MKSSEQDNKFSELLRGALASTPEAGACARFDSDDATAYLEKALSKAELEVYESHLAECAGCRQQLLELSRLSPATPVTVITPAIVGVPWWQWVFSGWRLGLAGGLAATAAAVLIFVVVNRNAGPVQVASRNETSAEVVEPTRTVTETPQLKEVAKPVEARRSEVRAEDSVKGADSSKDQGLVAGAVEMKKVEPKADLPSPPAAAMAPIVIDGANAKVVAEVENKAKEESRDAIRDRAEQSARNSVSSNSARIVSGPMQNQANQIQVVPAESMRSRPAAKAEMTRSVSSAKKPEERTVRGKKFTLVGGTWVDAESVGIKGIPLVEIKRGSEEFSKLETDNPELKEIFALGKVLVLWKGKLYKTLE